MPRPFSRKLIASVFFLLLLDLCLAPQFPFSVRPIFLYLMIPYAAFQWHWARTFPLALAAGLARDLAGSQPFGVETLVLGLTAWGFDFLVQKIDREVFLMRLAAAFLFVFLVTLGGWILSAFLGSSVPNAGTALSFAMGTALGTTLCMPVVFYAAALVFRDRLRLKQYELFR